MAFLALQICFELFLPQNLRSTVHSEGGPHETMQALLMVFSFLIALCGVKKAISAEKKWLASWFGLAAICCLYVGGEEVSWGQHIFDWATPQFWLDVNDQQETNLHNTSSWLDQKPRLVLEIGILVGGLVLPLIEKLKSGFLPERFEIIYPPAFLSVIAALVIVPKLIDKAGEAVDVSVFERVSELQELYMFYFVLLYLIALKKRLKT